MNSTAIAAGRVATAAADSGQRWGYPHAKTSEDTKAPLHRVVDLVRELAAKGEDPIPDVLQALQQAVASGRAALLLMAPNQFAAQVTDSTLWQQANPPVVDGVHAAPPKTPRSARKAGTGAATSGAHLVAVKPPPAAATQAGVAFAFELLHRLVASEAASLDDPAHPAARLAVFAADAEAVFPSLGPERSFWDVPDGPYVPLKVAPGAVVDLVRMPGPAESTSAAPAVAPAAHAGPPSGSAVSLVAVQGHADGGQARGSVPYTTDELQRLVDAAARELKVKKHGYRERVLDDWATLMPGREKPFPQSLGRTLARAKSKGIKPSNAPVTSVFDLGAGQCSKTSQKQNTAGRR